MRPTLENLVAFKGHDFHLGLRATQAKAAGAVEKRDSAKLKGGSTLSIEAADGDAERGMWVHYLETRATYGLAEAGETWAASGPFSGCHIVVGKAGGRIFVAHLAQQSGSTADEDWAKRAIGGEVWGRWKVPIPSQSFFSGSIVFVDWSAGTSPKNIVVVRLDVKVKTMGGSDGQIYEVARVA